MTATTLPRPADREAWLDLRESYFNASDAATLFGEHPFTSLGDVAVRKLTGHRQRDDNQAMTRGRRLEDAIAAWWSDEHGLAVYEPDVLHLRAPILATLDRLIVGTDTDAVEVKTTAKKITRPERYWWWQVQAQCWAAGLDRVHLAVLDASMDLTTYVVQRDDDAIAELVARAQRFMDQVAKGVVPVEADLVYRHLNVLAVAAEPSPPVTLTAEQALAVDELADVRAKLRLLGDAEDRLKAEVAEALGTATEGRYGGDVVVTWRPVTSSRLDIAAVRARHPSVYAECSTATTTRHLRVVKS
jgi:putative phage-type endonuclease